MQPENTEKLRNPEIATSCRHLINSSIGAKMSNCQNSYFKSPSMKVGVPEAGDKIKLFGAHLLGTARNPQVRSVFSDSDPIDQDEAPIRTKANIPKSSFAIGKNTVKEAHYFPSKVIREQMHTGTGLRKLPMRMLTSSLTMDIPKEHGAPIRFPPQMKVKNSMIDVRPAHTEEKKTRIENPPALGEGTASTRTSCSLQRSKASEKCQCPRDKELPCCVKAANWIKIIYNNRGSHFNFPQYKTLYHQILNTDVDLGKTQAQDLIQIKRDLNRTFPSCGFFGEYGVGQDQLERILITFLKYDPKIGYVQGMNFIVGALLFHASEEIAFWLFVSLIEEYEMRDIYLPELPGLFKHTQILDKLVKENLPAVYSHFVENEIKVEMFATRWIFTLFACVIPIDFIDAFLEQFFSHSWIFFYQFTIHLMRSIESSILSATDISDMFAPIKEKKTESSFEKFFSFMPALQKLFFEGSWADIIRGSSSEKLNTKLIGKMLDSFDPISLSFGFSQGQVHVQKRKLLDCCTINLKFEIYILYY